MSYAELVILTIENRGLWVKSTPFAESKLFEYPCPRSRTLFDESSVGPRVALWSISDIKNNGCGEPYDDVGHYHIMIINLD